MRQSHPTLRGWLELIRPPNLFTVPGDPLAGFVLAGGAPLSTPGPALLTATTACLLYMAGLIWNDCADAAEDQKQRPQRPIPSGRVQRHHALAAATLLALVAIAAAWLASPAAGIIALTLTTLILAYNFAVRNHPFIGFLAMGLCRCASLLLGAAAVGPSFRTMPAPWIAATAIALYIMAVTFLAHKETHQHQLGIKPWLPLMAAALLLMTFATHNPWAASISIFAIATIAHRAWLLRGEPHPAIVQQSIGSLIRSLLILQAALCASIPETGLLPALALLIAWPCATITGRWFYGS